MAPSHPTGLLTNLKCSFGNLNRREEIDEEKRKKEEKVDRDRERQRERQRETERLRTLRSVTLCSKPVIL